MRRLDRSRNVPLSGYALLTAVVMLWVCPSVRADSSSTDRVVSVSYEGSDKEGELSYPVEFHLWIPAGDQPLRGIIVHQHGCGIGAQNGGQTAAYDLHWQALARKWNCALLGPSYRAEEGANCRLWCDPRNGSGDRFLQALDALAKKASRPELVDVPWCLWGHSGGGFWASLMQTRHPEKIVAIWLQSGTAFGYWTSGEIPAPEISAAVYQVPVSANPGKKEEGHERFRRAWDGAWTMFNEYRRQGAPICFTPDPNTGHECGDSRYLSIPYFDALLSLRLPPAETPTAPLRLLNIAEGWLGSIDGTRVVAASSPDADELGTASWLPSESIARQWQEFLKTGAVSDATPPPAPHDVTVTPLSEGGIAIAWSAHADFESGIQAFEIYRDGERVGRVPEKSRGRFGRPLFQGLSYHDTPEAPLPEMIFHDRQAGAERSEYRVVTVNSVGLKSEMSPPARRRTTDESAAVETTSE